MFCDAASFIEPTNNNNDEEEYIFRDVLGSKFKGYNSVFSPINTPIEIELETNTRLKNFQMVLVEKGYLNVIWEEATVMSFNNEHNHEISIETVKFSTTYKNFSKEIMKQIEFYVMHSQCDAGTIRNLFQLKYPDHVFLIQDLGNAIQRIKQEKGLNLGEIASLLIKLLELQANDPAYLFILIDNYNKSRLVAQAFMQNERQELYEWLLQCCLEACEIPPLTFVTDADPAMIAAISIVFSETHHMQCLYYFYQNLSKNLRSCLGSSLY
ncbi:6110_t:CDS:2 [Funneliformis caledonium]|uniref:6110_t:CDS:1 n=1 Tax=Funneliformis caledonium TaxID=1117310 RepID=A0A9N9HH87_9GLOM|nr:6110_t:CDS:2 [Funneliformis caledonium]